MLSNRTVGRPRLEHRRLELLNAAANVFARKGFDAGSVRDIASAANVQPSSLYHFFGSKETLFEEVYMEGVRRIKTSVETAVVTQGRPWDKLEAAAAAHLTSLLEDDFFSVVVAETIPKGTSELNIRLIVHRNDYEKMFIAFIDRLPNLTNDNKKYLRFALFGALNATVNWYQPGKDSPEEIARRIVGLFRVQLDT
ncbi:MAG: TetR/AcrR family transcriptional regulator [Sneathiella sp.]|uniref:TetR/AcrR family transcriptional regulator n=1 Tax=Sneathiella sp. TaxID=1964365 RepID=UPI003001C7D1